MKRLALHLLSPLAALSLGACEGAFLTTDSTIDEGNQALVEKQFESADQAYQKAAASLPESPELNYLRGLASSALGRHEEAQALFMRALATKDKDLEQRVKAALGLAYARQALALEKEHTDGEGKLTDAKPSLERWQHAVSFLEEALGLNPLDADSRRTLEVALLRVDPPCHTRDDSYEANDRPEAAALLTLSAEEETASEGNPQLAQAQKDQAQDLVKFKEQLFSCPDNEDHYKVELQAGDRVEFKVTTAKDAGAIAVSLFSPDNQLVATLSPDGAATHILVAPHQAGAWRISQSNIDFEEVSYSLEIKRRPSCQSTEDHLEDNDSLAQARTLTPGALSGLKACPGDDDFYALTLAEGESLFVAATPQPKANSEKEKNDAEQAPKQPLLALELYREDGTLISQGAPAGEGRLAALLTPGAGRYVVRVAAAPLVKPTAEGDTIFEGRYDLNAHIMPPCPEGNDGYEPNDSFAQASDFTEATSQSQSQQGQQGQSSPQVFARICPGDTDWWTFTATEAKPSIISMAFDHVKGDLDLRLWDEAGRTILETAQASSADINGESLALPLPEKAANPDEQVTPKVSKLEVFAKDGGENFYILRLDQPQGGGGGDSSDDSDDSEDDNQESKDSEQDKDAQEDSKEQPSESDTMKELLDKLDRNPENLPARDAAKQSPLSNQKPSKDW